MSTYGLLMCVPLLALLLWAAAEDLHARRIPNWLTLGLILSGLAQSFAPAHLLTPGQAMLGLLAGFALPLLLFAINALGGGDVKLLAGVGAWLGAAWVLEVFLVAAVLGMLIVLGQAMRQHRIRALLRNSAVLAINLANVEHLGIEHVSATGQSCRSIDRPLPYAVPVLVATVLVLWNVWIAGGRP